MDSPLLSAWTWTHFHHNQTSWLKRKEKKSGIKCDFEGIPKGIAGKLIQCGWDPFPCEILTENLSHRCEWTRTFSPLNASECCWNPYPEPVNKPRRPEPMLIPHKVLRGYTRRAATRRILFIGPNTSAHPAHCRTHRPLCNAGLSSLQEAHIVIKGQKTETARRIK